MVVQNYTTFSFMQTKHTSILICKSYGCVI